MSLRELYPWFNRTLPLARDWPGYGMGSLHREIDRAINEFLGGDLAPVGGNGANGGRLAPRMDVAESETAFEVTADLPGVEQKDVEVSLSDGVLRIAGERKSEKEEKKKNYHQIERNFGRFERAMSLPDGIDEAKIAANFKDGVLRLTLPKSQKARETTKKIEIKSA